ncbi:MULTISPECIES: helix-turn-helix transcriptional regulator [Burkholderia]|uniref:Helix-turn-helix transcriptional regulator n=2 Tax=Burkholderia humptydooensis TaxID=430531 RepID=A0A7U4P9T0_9BURK|nr:MULTISPECIES: helix-turn-helix transcriptional regulator [Burkholderia]AGK49795.1 helix-turn-helix family protein [Burkholderia thailandensis MSMB121]ATF32540.1 XRE family transcriptional regulator [Burkholderia thailandensis]AJY39779.1 helix-turn-helix family protein [Burkholderia sp. 2002721687]ALX45524.1 DNA-binding protein [Burkholderia humptydooensis]EIP86467.1 DNA-binding protein [Burkholderia humptydooensis MSMB43]
MTALVQRFGAAIRQLREARAWSQEQLAEHAGLNRSYVGEIERGTAIASIVTVDKLARAFGVPIARLLTPSGEVSESAPHGFGAAPASNAPLSTAR